MRRVFLVIANILNVFFCFLVFFFEILRRFFAFLYWPLY